MDFYELAKARCTTRGFTDDSKRKKVIAYYEYR